MFGKKILVSLLTFILILPMAIGLVGCGPKIQIALDKSEIVLDDSVNSSTIVVTATEDGQAVSLEKLVWESSDTNVATVDNGVVNAVGVGNAQITCSYKGQSREVFLPQ